MDLAVRLRMRRTYILGLALTLPAACAARGTSSPADDAYDETGIVGPTEAMPAVEGGKLDADGEAGPRVADGAQSR